MTRKDLNRGPIDYIWIGLLSTASAASLTASVKVGWAWQVLAISSELAPNSIARANSEIKFPGLKPGFYILELRSRTEVDYHSEVSTFSFEITSPWYLSTVSKIIYLLIFLFVFLGYRKFLKHRNDKYVEKLKLIEKQKRQRQREKFELEKLGTDKELLLLKEKNLNLEIKKKDSALALSTLNNIKKNELLNDLINDLKVSENEFLNSSINSPVSRVLKKINIK